MLSHYEAKERENKTDSFINILTTNRHAAIVMDSDRRNSRGRINETKLRVKKEFEENGYFCWVTKGKEIENYVSSDAVNRSFGSSLLQIEQYELFPDYIKKYDKNFSSHKIDTARKLCDSITAENSAEILDLKERVEELYRVIKSWN